MSLLHPPDLQDLEYDDNTYQNSLPEPYSLCDHHSPENCAGICDAAHDKKMTGSLRRSFGTRCQKGAVLMQGAFRRTSNNKLGVYKFPVSADRVRRGQNGGQLTVDECSGT